MRIFSSSIGRHTNQNPINFANGVTANALVAVHNVIVVGGITVVLAVAGSHVCFYHLDYSLAFLLYLDSYQVRFIIPFELLNDFSSYI